MFKIHRKRQIGDEIAGSGIEQQVERRYGIHTVACGSRRVALAELQAVGTTGGTVKLGFHQWGKTHFGHDGGLTVGNLAVGILYLVDAGTERRRKENRKQGYEKAPWRDAPVYHVIVSFSHRSISK